MPEALTQGAAPSPAASTTAQQGAAQTPASTEQTFKVKIDGVEQTVTQSQLIKGYQLEQVAQQKLQQAGATQRQAEQFIKILKSNPRAVLSDPSIGVDIKAFATQILQEAYEDEIMSPEQRDAKNAKAELAKYKEEAEARQRAEDEKTFQEQSSQFYDYYDQEFTKAIAAEGLPKTEFTVARMASYQTEAIKRGLTQVTPAQIAQLVRQDYIKEINALFSAAADDTLVGLTGEDLANKFIKAQAAAMKKKQSLPQNGQPRAVKVDGSGKAINPHAVSDRKAWKQKLKSS